MNVEGKHSDGCGIQCIAKVTGKKASVIREMASANYIHGIEIVSILKKLGYKTATPFRSTLFDDKIYIATVPSLNHVGEFHFVVIWWNGKHVMVADSVKSSQKNRYVSQSKKNLIFNEIKIKSWTSLIEVIKK